MLYRKHRNPRLNQQMYFIAEEETSSSSSPRLTVETMDNHVYFYADVDSDRVLALIRAIRNLDAVLREQKITRGLDFSIPIWLHINSEGGDLFSGFCASDQIKMIKSPIYSIVEGLCASAATLISMSCTKRYILPNSFMLVHQLSGMKWGTHEEFEDEINLQNKAMERLSSFYVGYSSIKIEEVRDMLKRDTWLDADECEKKGFVDEIYKGI